MVVLSVSVIFFVKMVKWNELGFGTENTLHCFISLLWPLKYGKIVNALHKKRR